MQWQPELFFSGITLADFSGSELVVEGVLTLVFCSVLYAVIGKNTIPALRFDSVDWAGRKRAELEAAWSPMLKGVARLATAAAPKGTEPLGLWTMSIVQAGEQDSADVLGVSHAALHISPGTNVGKNMPKIRQVCRPHILRHHRTRVSALRTCIHFCLALTCVVLRHARSAVCDLPQDARVLSGFRRGRNGHR